MNFIKKKNDGDRITAEDRFNSGGMQEMNAPDYQKVINRQGSKKLIQGAHMMHHHNATLGHLHNSNA